MKKDSLRSYPLESVKMILLEWYNWDGRHGDALDHKKVAAGWASQDPNSSLAMESVTEDTGETGIFLIKAERTGEWSQSNAQVNFCRKELSNDVQ